MTLHAAVGSGNTAAVKLLLERGAEVPQPGDVVYEGVPFVWAPHNCSLSSALMNKNFSSGMYRGLLEAGHAANCDHVARSVEKNDPALVKAVLARALERETHPAGGRRCPIGEVPLSRAFRKGGDGDMRVLEVLIAENLLLKEMEYEVFSMIASYEFHPQPSGEPRVPKPDNEYGGHDEYPAAMSFPVGYAVREKCSQKALFVLLHQVLQGIATTGSVRWIVEQVCNLYVADQSRPSGKPPQYHATCFDFIKGFHPDFTRCFIDDEQCEGSDEEIEDHKWQLRCDLLMRLVLSSRGPSHAVVKYLLANGCRISAAALAEEIQHWDESVHCLMRRYKDADVELCKKCVKSDAFAYQIGKKKHTLRSRVSHLDAILARASPAVLNDKVRLSDNPEAVDIEKVALLSYAITRRLWIVAYRLIHHGADFTSLDEDAKASVRELYRETFHGGSHPLVVDARAGKFVPDTKVFTRGLKGDGEKQALTLVMLTIGLPSET